MSNLSCQSTFAFSVILCLLISPIAVFAAEVSFPEIPVLDPQVVDISTRDYSLGKIRISVTNAKLRDGEKAQTALYACAAWLRVWKDQVEVERIVYKNIEPVGSSYGIFVPEEQPGRDFFVAVKLGDYDGDTIVIDRQGVLRIHHGGQYFRTKDTRYLIMILDSDLWGLEVMNLQTGAVTYNTFKLSGAEEGSLPDRINRWYWTPSIGYFGIEVDDLAELPSKASTSVFRFDDESGTFARVSIPSRNIRNAEAVVLDFDPIEYEDCKCSEKRQKE